VSPLAWTAACQAVSRGDRNPYEAPCRGSRPMVGNRFPSPEDSVRFAGDPLRGWTQKAAVLPCTQDGPERYRASSTKQLRCCGRMPRCQRGRASSILASCTGPDATPAMTSSTGVRRGLQNCKGPVRFRRSSPRVSFFHSRRLRNPDSQSGKTGSNPVRDTMALPADPALGLRNQVRRFDSFQGCRSDLPPCNRDDVGNERRPIPGSESVRLAPSRPSPPRRFDSRRRDPM
jgi:hypothetical protein